MQKSVGNFILSLVRHQSQLTLSCLQALFLPEASDYIAASPEETIALVRSMGDSVFVKGLQDEARNSNIPINVGIHEPAESGKKVKNTLIWIDDKGNIVQRYQKIHLFDIDIKGGLVLKESKYGTQIFSRAFSVLLRGPEALKRACRYCPHLTLQ